MDGRFLFAYGSLLCPDRMRLLCPDATPGPVGVASMDGYEFIINRRGLASLRGERDIAYGRLWRIGGEDNEKVLDRYEGVEVGLYRKCEWLVQPLHGQDPVPSLVYLATDLDVGVPHPSYLGPIVAALEALVSQGIPEDYVERVRQWLPGGSARRTPQSDRETSPDSQ